MHSLAQELPTLYGKLLPRLAEQEAPREQLATCARCTMACAERPLERRFSPDTKCCTYFPTIPNFLVGAILAEQDPSDPGRQRIEQLIAEREGISPAGIAPSMVYKVLYERGSTAGFGVSKSLQCPLYLEESGGCAIWRHREAVCSTYFCRSVAGPAGKAFWMAVKSQLLHIQKALAIFAILRSGIPSGVGVIEDQLLGGKGTALTLHDLEGTIDETKYSNTWNAWMGRERDFFLECYRIVSSMTPEEAASAGGSQYHYLEAKVEAKMRRITEIPPVLTRTKKVWPVCADGSCYLVQLGPYGPAEEIPRVLLDSFDGNMPTAAIRKRFADVSPVTPELVWRLFYHGALQGPVNGCLQTTDTDVPRNTLDEGDYSLGIRDPREGGVA